MFDAPITSFARGTAEGSATTHRPIWAISSQLVPRRAKTDRLRTLLLHPDFDSGYKRQHITWTKLAQTPRKVTGTPKGTPSHRREERGLQRRKGSPQTDH